MGQASPWPVPAGPDWPYFDIVSLAPVDRHRRRRFAPAPVPGVRVFLVGAVFFLLFGRLLSSRWPMVAQGVSWLKYKIEFFTRLAPSSDRSTPKEVPR